MIEIRMRAAGGLLAVVCADSGLRWLGATLLGQGLTLYATREEALAG